MLSIRYGIPRHGAWNHEKPDFEKEGVNVIRLDDFPLNDSPSGGVSNRISPSEMFLVIASCPKAKSIRQVWKDNTGNVLSDTQQFGNNMYEFLGRFSGEITQRGKYSVDVIAGKAKQTVNFEVI